VARIDRLKDKMRAGFLAIRAPQAGELCAALRQRGVFADARGEIMRLGPAPYLSDDQLAAAIDLLGEAVRGL
jgi:kynureninase